MNAEWGPDPAEWGSDVALWGAGPPVVEFLITAKVELTATITVSVRSAAVEVTAE